MAETAPNQPIDTRRYRTSWRLTFRFDGQRINLIRRERLQKIAPGTTAETPEPGRNSGAWLELVDRSGQVLFHRLLYDPLRTRAEHHSPDGRIELHVRTPEPSEFTEIVPDIPAASEVILYSSPTEYDRMHEAAREIGRYSLGERGAGGDQRPEPTGDPQQGPTSEAEPDEDEQRLERGDDENER
jgi:hypothetical protein